MMDFLVMTLRADGTTVLSSVTQIASPDGRCLMIWRRLPVQSGSGITGWSVCSVCGWRVVVGLGEQVLIKLLLAAGANVLV